MKALIQRVREARVEVEGEVVGAIKCGLLVLLGVEQSDDSTCAKKLAERVCRYRVFSDNAGKMNLDVSDIKGEILVVSQFTLVADTSKGRRPSFSDGAPPEHARALYEEFCTQIEMCGVNIAQGRFAADMQVHLINDGPVTFMLDV